MVVVQILDDEPAYAHLVELEKDLLDCWITGGRALEWGGEGRWGGGPGDEDACEGVSASVETQDGERTFCGFHHLAWAASRAQSIQLVWQKAGRVLRWRRAPFSSLDLFYARCLHETSRILSRSL